MQKRIILLCGVGLCLLGLPAHSQPIAQANASATSSQDGDPMVPYRAYRAAVESGNLAQAATEALSAWRLAEARWGASNPNTAGLAYNAAWSAVLVGKAGDRIDAGRRAVELAPQARDAYDVLEAQFLLAYGEYFAAKVEDRPKLAAKLAAAALPIETTWQDYLVVNALVQSVTNGVTESRGRVSVALADRTLAVIDRVAPTDRNARALTLLARAQGRLVGGFDSEEAVADLIQARVAYGPMRGLDDPNWGTLGAWELAARSVVLTNDNLTQTMTGTRITRRTQRPLSMTEAERFEVGKRPTPIAFDSRLCDAVQRKPRLGSNISYPSSQSGNYRVAGVMVRTDIAPDGRTTNVRLLGAVPPGPFGENALAAVRTWRYDVPANTPVQCLQGRDIGVSFAIGSLGALWRPNRERARF
jgi:TonB family protein